MFLVVFGISPYFPGCLPRFFSLPWYLLYLNLNFTFTFLSSIWALHAESRKRSSSSTCDIFTYRAGAFAQLNNSSDIPTYFIRTPQHIRHGHLELVSMAGTPHPFGSHGRRGSCPFVGRSGRSRGLEVGRRVDLDHGLSSWMSFKDYIQALFVPRSCKTNF